MGMIKKFGITTIFAASLGVCASVSSAETVKIAFIDPLSGAFAPSGTMGLSEFTHAADYLINSKGGVLGGQKIEIIGFDNKISPKESLIQLQVVIDQGIRYIAQGNSSGVANALTDAVNKHNRRNPDNRILFLNYSAVDPALTNDKCNFWHFRFDANADMKMDALTDVMKKNEDFKKVYLIGQDYSFGKAVAAAAVKNLSEKRPDIEFVGNELHPINKVKDFTPYARKIVASGADAVITGNWGADMVGLGKAIVEAGFSGPIFTYYGASTGITKAFGAAGKGSLYVVGEGSMNPPVSDAMSAYVDAFEAKYGEHDNFQPRIANVIEMLARAINDAGTATDVVKVAYALEGMKHDSIFGGQVYMRPDDHQAIQNIDIAVHTNEGIRHPFDNSEYGLFMKDEVVMASADSATTCKMKRP